MRRGEGTKFAIVRMLRSGTPLVLIEENRQTGYTRVKTEGGTEGYVLTRYLMQEPAAREQLQTLTQDKASLVEKIARLEADITSLQQNSGEQTGRISTLQSDKQTLERELSELQEATADVLAIRRENTRLSEQVEQLSADKEALLVENRTYRDNTRQDWFVRGAGVVLLGVLIGLILPKLKRRRRWGDL